MNVLTKGGTGLDDVAAAAGGLDGLVGWMNLGFHDVVTVFAGRRFYQSRLTRQALLAIGIRAQFGYDRVHLHAPACRSLLPTCVSNSVSSTAPVSAPRPAFVRVAVAKPLRGLFDYSLPAQMPVPPLGARVEVPFGNATLIGVCMEYAQQASVAKHKPIKTIIDPELAALPSDTLAMARWLASYYLHPIGEVVSSLLPVAARRGAPLSLPSITSYHLLDLDAVAAQEPEPPPALNRAKKQAALWRFLVQCGGYSDTQAIAAAGFGTSIIKALLEKGLVRSSEATAGPSQATLKTPPLRLTGEQTRALAAINAKPDQFFVHLLDGVTGSGITEVYLQAIAGVLERGFQVLVLVPEIALTPQTLARFRDRFGSAASLHSRVSDSKRLHTWIRCRDGLEPLLIGTRSAILTPFARLGLIIVDEEHDPSFKQTDGLRYSARDLAVKRAQDLNIPLVLGSATPALESLHNVASGRYESLVLSERPGGAQMPPMRLLDIRGVRLEEGLAPELFGTIEQHISAGNQALIFINRRGYAPTYLCISCQWQAKCPNCTARFTLHQRPRELRCHHCGLRAPIPRVCPDCHANTLIAIGIGTQRTEEVLQQRFPDVDLIRVDRDSTRSQQRLEQQLAQINEGHPALLVGTQMLAKGHHFPNVTLVVIVDADSGFLAADYRAPERTAALITQVAGRAGRAERPGEVIIQTLHPTNPVLTALIEGGYPRFAAIELANRAAAGFPPYAPIALLRADGLDERQPQQLLATLVAPLRAPSSQSVTAGLREVQVSMPAPAPMGRIAGRFRYQCLITAADRTLLHRALALIVQFAPASRHGRLSWSLDVDPYDTY